MMKRNQTLHEQLIPMIVEGIGADSYLEFGTYLNETISKVKCKYRYGVDTNPTLFNGISFFEMTTQEFIEDLAAEYAPFDVVFLDADHSASSVMADFKGIWPHVSAEGLILLHDANPETGYDVSPSFCGDAWKAVKKITQFYECVTLPYHPGLTIVRKRDRWGPE